MWNSMDTRTDAERDLLARVSPELALVDPELGRRLRLRLPARLPRTRPPLPVLRLLPPPETSANGAWPASTH
jgi:hypothetical protein